MEDSRFNKHLNTGETQLKWKHYLHSKKQTRDVSAKYTLTHPRPSEGILPGAWRLSSLSAMLQEDLGKARSLHKWTLKLWWGKTGYQLSPQQLQITWRCIWGLEGSDMVVRDVTTSSLGLWSMRSLWNFSQEGANFTLLFKRNCNRQASQLPVCRFSGCLLPHPVGALGLSKSLGFPPPP